MMTAEVLHRDREAIRQISKRIQNEQTWTEVYKQMEQVRRSDLRAELQIRQAMNDRLMELSGQPVLRSHGVSQHELPNSCTLRSKELSQHKVTPLPKDITMMQDFRGLYYADRGQCLEVLFPGKGHAMSTEFRESATRSVEPGWPPPQAAETPRMKGRISPERSLDNVSWALKTASIPTSSQRLQSGVLARGSDESMVKAAKAQFLLTTSPVPPDQKQLLAGKRDMVNTMNATSSSLFSSFSGSTPFDSAKTIGEKPPPMVPLVYPVLASSTPSPSAKSSQHSPFMLRNKSAPTLEADLSTASFGSSLAGVSKMRRRQDAQAAVTAVCRELDHFEATVEALPRICNFYGTPRASGAASAAHSNQDARGAGL